LKFLSRKYLRMRSPKLGLKGGQAAEYGMLCFIAALTPLIASPSMMSVTRDLYDKIAYRLAHAASLSQEEFVDEGEDEGDGGLVIDPGEGGEDDVEGPDPDPGDEEEDESGGESDEVDEEEVDDSDACGEWVDLDEGFAQGPHVFQARVPGNVLGLFRNAKVDKKTGELDVLDVESLGYESEQLLLLIEFDGSRFYFTEHNRLSLFTLDGQQKIVNRALIKENHDPYFQGDEHIVSHNNKLVIDIGGLPEASGTVTYGEASFEGEIGRGNDNGRFDFSEFGCLVFPPWYEGEAPNW
jgi:hypothetical protein